MCVCFFFINCLTYIARRVENFQLTIELHSHFNSKRNSGLWCSYLRKIDSTINIYQGTKSIVPLHPSIPIATRVKTHVQRIWASVDRRRTACGDNMWLLRAHDSRVTDEYNQ